MKKVSSSVQPRTYFLGFFCDCALYILVDYNVTLFVLRVMSLSCNFPDYKDTFTPSKPFPLEKRQFHGFN
ncbi:hypothetical protein Scep_010095 [Stephania cephalantha]|uniref:Uncharacterized protein n=1 Tax=Stephania cephalantha TaxID=152367 RepID=A0AAP0JV38_9MAGN